MVHDIDGRRPLTGAAASLLVDNVSFSYGGVKALDRVTLKAAPGSITGLIGPNGSGKSTLINLISGAQTGLAEGSIQLAGTDITRVRASGRVSKGLGRIFQGIRLFDSLTIEENIMLGGHSTFSHSLLSSIVRTPTCRRELTRAREEAAQVMQLFGDRLYPRRNQQVLSLSYANRRRVEIARALMTHPSLLLLDEPMAGMNPHETEELTMQLSELNDSMAMSMLLVEHKMSVIGDLCEHVYVLDAGKVIAEGTAAAVQTDPRVMEAFLGTK